MSKHSVDNGVKTFCATAIVTALAAFVPQGQAASFGGGSPSNVFMTTNPGVCALDQGLSLGSESQLLVHFTFMWTGLGGSEVGLVWFDLDGEAIPLDWFFPGNARGLTTGTVMWSFEDVAPGTHIISPRWRVDAIPPGPHPNSGEPSADLFHCALTVVVIPAE